MAGRYASAFQQIREILESRTQAQPILQAKHVSDELTCWPIPPLRTIRRYMEHVRQVRKLSEIGRRGQKTPRAA
jgi:hypothetical protein